jgi:hypothetical protein
MEWGCWFALLATAACSAPKPLTRPMENYATNLSDKRSSIYIPVAIKISTLEKTVNAQLEGVLYEDKDLRDGDRMMIRATKAAPIKLGLDGQTISFTVPAAIWVRYDAGITVVDAQGKIAIDFKTAYNVKPDWSLSTQTTIANYRWLEKPVLKIAGINLPVGLLADLALQNMRKTIAGAIDEAVTTDLGIGKMVADTWKSMFRPTQISADYNTWLIVNPLGIGMTPIRVSADTMTTTIVVEARPRITVGDAPPAFSERPLPPYTQFSNQEPGFSIFLPAEVSYTEAQRLAGKEIIGETYTSGKRAVTVEGIEIYGQGEEVILNLSMSGSYNGSVYLKGRPFYNAARNAIEVEGLDFTLETRNFLVKSGAWLLKSTLRKRLQESLDFYLRYNLEESRKALEKQLNEYSLAGGFRLQARVDQLDVGNVALRPDGFMVEINLKGNIEVRN